MTAIPDTPYSYAEFEKHFYGYLAAMDAENEAFAAANGVEVQPDFCRSAFFLRDFTETHESDPTTRARKALVIHRVLGYMIDHAEALDVGRHLVRGAVSLLFSNYLVEAIFRTFLPSGIYNGMLWQPDPRQVLHLAEELRQRDDSAS